MTEKPYGEIMDEMDNEAKYLPVDDIIAEIVVTMKHARMFISSREKMHPTGIELYDELLEKLVRRRYPVTSPTPGNVRGALEAVQHWDEHESNPASYGGLPRRVRDIVDTALDPTSVTRPTSNSEAK